MRKLFGIVMMLACIVSCQKKEVPPGRDATPPVITLNGDNPFMHRLNHEFVDPGTSALDDRDGPIKATVSGSIDVNLPETYTLTYIATDRAGNSSTVSRQVTVFNEDTSLAGQYSVTCNCKVVAPYHHWSSTYYNTYTTTIKASRSRNREFTLSHCDIGPTVLVDVKFISAAEWTTQIDFPSAVTGRITFLPKEFYLSTYTYTYHQGATQQFECTNTYSLVQ